MKTTKFAQESAAQAQESQSMTVLQRLELAETCIEEALNWLDTNARNCAREALLDYKRKAK